MYATLNARCNRCINCFTVDAKIKGLDDDMRRFKEQLKKTPNNATIKKRAMDTLKRKVAVSLNASHSALHAQF